MANNKGSKTTLIIVVIILGVLLVGGLIAGGTCYYLYKIGKNLETSQPETNTATWLDYNNNRYKFYIKFPKTFNAFESENGDGITLTSNDPPITIRTYASNNVLSQSLDEYLNDNRTNLFREQKNSEEILAEAMTLGENKIPAQERQWQYLNSVDGSLTLTDQVTTLKDDTFYTIQMVVSYSDYDEYPAHLFDNILQSFKIL